MIYTIYNVITGEILRIVICNDPEQQIANGETYIQGGFSDIDYIVSNGQAVAKPTPIFDVDAAAMQIRIKRNKLLAACDWTQVNDVPAATSQKWSTYRQELRDITKQQNFPVNVVFPVAPI
jgi:hypothetical protein